MTDKIICAEMTADGARHFIVESEAAYDALVSLSDNGSAEADVWGGFEFNVDTSPYNEDDDTGFYDADGTTVEDYLKGDPITLKQVEDATPGEDDSEEDFEDAFITIIQG